MHFAEVEHYVTQYFCKILPEKYSVYSTPQLFKRGDVFKAVDYKQGAPGTADLVITARDKLYTKIPNSLYGLIYIPPHKNKVGKKYEDAPEKLLLCHYFDNDALKLSSVYKKLKIKPAKLTSAEGVLSKKTGSTNRYSGIAGDPEVLQYNDYTGISDERATSLVVRVYGNYDLEEGLDLFKEDHRKAFIDHLSKNITLADIPFDIKKAKATSNKVTVPQLTDFALTVSHKPDRLLFDNQAVFSNESKLKIANALIEHKPVIYDHYKKLGFSDELPWTSRYVIVSDDKPTQLVDAPFEVQQSIHEAAVLPSITFEMPESAINDLVTKSTFTGQLQKIEINHRMKTFVTIDYKQQENISYGVLNIHKGQLSVLH